MEQEVNNGSSRESEIDLFELLYVIWRRIGFVIAAAIICSAIAFLYCKTFVTPMYEASASLYVLNRTDESTITSSDITSSTALTNDYQYIATSHLVVDQVIEKLNLKEEYTYGSLCNEINVSVLTDSRMLSITVTDSDPYRAKQIVDTLVEVMVETVTERMKTEISPIDNGITPNAPSSPNTTRWCIIGALLGILLTVAVIVIAYVLDDTIKSESDVEKYLGVPVLASIPLDKEASRSKAKKHKGGRKNA